MKLPQWTIPALIVGFILLTWLMPGPGKVDDTAIKMLQEENVRLREEGEKLKAQVLESKRRDSIQFDQYEKKVLKDLEIIKNLNKKRDENINRIDTADDNELRRILAGYR